MNHQNFSISRKIDRAIRDHSLVRHGQIIVVAVSGGVDSVVLLHYLASRVDLELSLVVAHLNHSLRGAESDGDEEFVRALAGSFGLRFECRRQDVASFAEEQRLSLEEAGRELRYLFFAEIAQITGAGSVAIAHHLDDQAETVLLRLLRGSGPTGLRGMSHRSADGRYIRPLLDVTRAEIEGYAIHNRLPYRTDSSNSDPSFLRNRIRLQLLPLLSEYNPAIALRLAETASIMAADEAVMSDFVAKRWQEVGEHSGDMVHLDADALAMNQPGMRYRLYRHSIDIIQGNLRRISYKHLQGIDRLLIEGAPNGRLNLPGRLIVIRAYEKIIFKYEANGEEPVQNEITVSSEGIYELSTGGKVSVSYPAAATPSAESGRMELIVDLAEFPFPWIIRTFRPGDRILQRGMNGHKKVKDLFIDEKISFSQRQKIPLFFSGGKLFWVAGIRKGGADRSYSPDASRVRVQLLEFMQNAAMLA